MAGGTFNTSCLLFIFIFGVPQGNAHISNLVFINETKTWREAREVCRRDFGGRLLTRIPPPDWYSSYCLRSNLSKGKYWIGQYEKFSKFLTSKGFYRMKYTYRGKHIYPLNKGSCCMWCGDGWKYITIYRGYTCLCINEGSIGTTFTSPEEDKSDNGRYYDAEIYEIVDNHEPHDFSQQCRALSCERDSPVQHYANCTEKKGRLCNHDTNSGQQLYANTTLLPFDELHSNCDHMLRNISDCKSIPNIDYWIPGKSYLDTVPDDGNGHVDPFLCTAYGSHYVQELSCIERHMSLCLTDKADATQFPVCTFDIYGTISDSSVISVKPIKRTEMDSTKKASTSDSPLTIASTSNSHPSIIVEGQAKDLVVCSFECIIIVLSVLSGVVLVLTIALITTCCRFRLQQVKRKQQRIKETYVDISNESVANVESDYSSIVDTSKGYVNEATNEQK